MTALKLNCRYCSCGCGQPLFTDQGEPDFSRRRFATKQCVRRDDARRIAAYRSSTKYMEKKQKRLRRLGAAPVKVRVSGQEIIVPTARAAFDLVAKHSELGPIELMKATRNRRGKDVKA